jgi:hypothetical protein
VRSGLWPGTVILNNIVSVSVFTKSGCLLGSFLEIPTFVATQKMEKDYVLLFLRELVKLVYDFIYSHRNIGRKRERLTAHNRVLQYDVGLVHSSSRCVIVGWAEEFKAETHVKAPSDVVLGAGVDPKLLEGRAPGGVKEPVDCCAAEASAAKSRTNSKPAEPANM